MRLQTARAVKQELSELFATRSEPRTFALGVATQTRSEFTVAVRAPSEELLREDDLDMIRRWTAGEVSVAFTGAITPITATQSFARATRVGLGVSVAHHRSSAGTLGFFARRKDDGTVGFVSNNHVLALEDHGGDGDEILHPAPRDGGRHPHNVIGHLAGTYPRLVRSTAPIDCAFARLAPGVDYDPLLLDPGQKLSAAFAGAEESPLVGKVGRTTGITHGRVSAFDMDGVMVEYSFGMVRFGGQIEVESADGTPFTREGDSGSLVFSRPGNHPVGLVFAASAIGGAGNAGLTYVHPIESITHTLGIEFEW